MKKGVSLDQFIAETEERLKNFREYWLEGHKNNPEMFPLELPEDNAGMWYEQFQYFDE